MLLGRAKDNPNIVPTDAQYRWLVQNINEVNLTGKCHPCIDVKWGDPIDHLVRFRDTNYFMDQVSVHANGDIVANIAEDNPKVKTIKFVTVFNAVCFLGVVAIIILSITGTIQLTDSSETMIASAITSLVILVLGNLCPKLPYSRHTGLRLPWTLADESTWILAHRILGYTAIPFGISNIIAMFSFQAPNIREGFAIGTFLLWVAIPSVISAIYFYKKRGSSY